MPSFHSMQRAQLTQGPCILFDATDAEDARTV